MDKISIATEIIMKQIDKKEMKIIEVNATLIVPADSTTSDIEDNFSFGENTTLLRISCENIDLEEAKQ